MYISSGPQFSYAIKEENDQRQVYSWGDGTNYVLGNRQEEAELQPYLIPKQFFAGENVISIKCAGQHVAFLSSPSGKQPEFEPNVFEVLQTKKKSRSVSKSRSESKKKTEEKVAESIENEANNEKNKNATSGKKARTKSIKK